jgi:hypothetical protein
MNLNAYDLSAGVFVRGLTNLKTQMTKAEAYAAASGRGEAALLAAQLAAEGRASDAPGDLHGYSLAAQVYWAAEGAKLAIARLLGTSHRAMLRQSRPKQSSAATRIADAA